MTLLLDQLRELGLSPDSPPDTAGWKALIARVDQAYAEAAAQYDRGFQVLVDQSPDAVFVHLDGVVVYANPAMVRLLGYDDPADLVGKLGVDTFVHPDDRAYVEAQRVKRAGGETVGAVTVRFVRRDGVEVHVQGRAAPIAFDGKSCSLTVARDITDRVLAERRRSEAEASLRLSEERYRVLFAESPLPIYLFDPESFEFIDVNDAWVRLYGYTREELVGMRVTRVKVQEDDPELRRISAMANAEYEARRAKTDGGGKAWRGVKMHRRKDGKLLELDITSHPVSIGGRVATMAIALEVNETRRLEDQLRQAQKMEAVGRLAGGVAHDFNNLLAAVMSYAELARCDLGSDHPVAEDIAQIIAAARRGADLTRQLLAFSRQTTVEPRVLSVNTIIGSLESMLRRLIGEDVTVSTVLARDLCAVEADRSHLEQVIINLAVNARDAMPAGGTLLIETRNVSLDMAAARAAGTVPGSHVSLTVTDTGHGMDDATQARIFEPFFTTKEPGKGTGLGLSMVFGIVRQSGGCVLVRSAPGKGATFEVLLPSVAAAPARSVQPPPGACGSAAVLLVEDEAHVREGIRRLLVARGYQVIEAASARDALDVFDASPERFDLLLTDVVMPSMGGRELASRLRARRAALPVLFMSGYTEHPALEGASSVPMEQLLQKPFTADQLAEAVARALGPASAKRGAA